ncbi:MAG: SapC family protein, partial [Alphaproteobacteria bacterium]|nr:SapC family protein [Alphaproteobacteria bacterium]
MSMDETTTAPLPVFYQRPSPLNAEVTLDAVASFDFARTTNAVPINAVEFAAAQRDYPIVFSNDAAPVAMAVLGLEERR